jgi:hypothetical protein
MKLDNYDASDTLTSNMRIVRVEHSTV